MQRMSVFGQALAAAVYLVGCGSGDDSGAEPPAFPDTNTPPVQTPEDTGTEPDGDTPGATDMPAGNEGMDPDLGLDPSETPDEQTPPEVDPVVPEVINNGRIVGGNCTLVCLDASTDPDAQGVTDGWGFEQSRSCLTPESQLALTSMPCVIPELLPLPALPPVFPPAGVQRPDGNLSRGFFVSGGRLFDNQGNVTTIPRISAYGMNVTVQN